MRIGWIVLFAGCAHASAGAPRAADDDREERVPIEQLPAPVRQAVDAAYPGASLLGAEHDGREWEVELVTAAGEHLEVEYDESGRFVESEPADEDEDDDEDEDED